MKAKEEARTVACVRELPRYTKRETLCGTYRGWLKCLGRKALGMNLLIKFQNTTKMEGSEDNRLPVKLESVVLNSIRHSFQTLDETNSGKVTKLQLQFLCASICLDIGTNYDAQHLSDFKSPLTTLSFQDFVEYLEDHLLSKG